MPTPLAVGGYVLAGGRSSRMGTDKALLRLADRPLVEHAVTKLRRVCADVSILAGEKGNLRGLKAYGPLVFDVHPDTGPIGGIEAALLHTPYDLNMIIPVDVPFVPAALLQWWVRRVAGQEAIRVASLTVEDVAQPSFLVIRKGAAPWMTQAIEERSLKLLPALQRAARELGAVQELNSGQELAMLRIDRDGVVEDALGAGHGVLRRSGGLGRLWFTNVNTPGDLAFAEANIDALDASIAGPLVSF